MDEHDDLAPIPAELRRVCHLARIAQLPTQIGRDGVLIELPTGAVVGVMRLRPPLDGFGVITAQTLPTLAADGAFDLASALAGLIRSGTVWPLHQLCDAAPHVVELAECVS